MNAKVQVSVRALEARAKRYAESHDNELLRKCRPDSRWYRDLGDYYFVDMSTNGVMTKDWNIHNLIEWAREEGILKPFEEVSLE